MVLRVREGMRVGIVNDLAHSCLVVESFIYLPISTASPSPPVTASSDA